MANDIAFAKNYAGVIDKVYQRASVSTVLKSSSSRMGSAYSKKNTTSSSQSIAQI